MIVQRSFSVALFPPDDILKDLKQLVLDRDIVAFLKISKRTS